MATVLEFCDKWSDRFAPVTADGLLLMSRAKSAISFSGNKIRFVIQTWALLVQEKTLSENYIESLVNWRVNVTRFSFTT